MIHFLRWAAMLAITPLGIWFLANYEPPIHRRRPGDRGNRWE